MTRDSVVTADQIIGHEVDIIDPWGHFFPVDGGLQVFGKSACGKADLAAFVEIFAQQPDQGRKMIFVRRKIRVSGYVSKCRVFPIQVDAVRVEIIGELFYGAYEFFSSFPGAKDEGTGLAASPSAQGEDHFQVGIFTFQIDHVPDGGAVPGIIDKKTVALQVAETVQD